MVLDMQGEGQSKQAHLFWGEVYPKVYHLPQVPKVHHTTYRFRQRAQMEEQAVSSQAR